MFMFLSEWGERARVLERDEANEDVMLYIIVQQTIPDQYGREDEVFRAEQKQASTLHTESRLTFRCRIKFRLPFAGIIRRFYHILHVFRIRG